MLTISAVLPSGEQIQQHPYPGTENRGIQKFQLLMSPTDNNPYCSEGTLGSSVVLDRPEKSHVFVFQVHLAESLENTHP